MRLLAAARRVTVFLLLSALLISSTQAYGQSAGQALLPPGQPDTQTVINRAEAAFLLGEKSFARGSHEEARRFFDEALDIIITSGINIREDAKLNSYYRKLLERIHKHEAQPGDKHEDEEQAEIVEPSALDEVADVKEDELAMTTPEGIKIYGKYDFDFSVAPPVFQFINYFVTGRGRSTMEVGLQRSGRYREMAEKIFKEERVPLDLIWLAQAESVWKPNALSRAAAKGIWQFIPSTGSRYGLVQTRWLDDRSHPEKSTRAAAKYLRFLYDFFAGDWLLAMAAYNSGEYRVAGAVARCGYADFWELFRRNLLPQETRNYVPIILAITIISKNQNRYGFSVTPDPALIYDTFDLPAQTDLKIAADLIGTSYDAMRDLNPELRHGVTPPDQRYTIKLPKGTRKQFEIAYAALPEEQRVRKIVIPSEEVIARRPTYKTEQASYRVRRGDTVHSLARRYNISPAELARLNRISPNGKLRKGQIVRVPKLVRSARASKASVRSRSGKAARIVKSNRGKAKVKKATTKKGATKSRSSRRRR